MVKKSTKEEQIKKDLDGWIEVFFIDPITFPLVPIVSKYISKNALFYTGLSFIAAILASILVLSGFSFFAGILYLLSIIFDGLDGKVARYNKSRVVIHGVVDVTTDIIKNSLLFMSIAIAYPQYVYYILAYVLIILTYEFTYSMRLDLKSRYFSGEIMTKGYSMTKLKGNYEKQLNALNNNSLREALKFYNVLFDKTIKYRTYPYPTLVDAEFVLFVLFLLTSSEVVLIISLIFLLPDMLISLLLTILLTIKAAKVHNE